MGEDTAGVNPNTHTHMPQSLHQKYGHLIFSTKNRDQIITGEVEPRLYEYMGGIVRGMNAALLEINGIPDHVHLLIREFHEDRPVNASTNVAGHNRG